MKPTTKKQWEAITERGYEIARRVSFAGHEVKYTPGWRDSETNIHMQRGYVAFAKFIAIEVLKPEKPKIKPPKGWRLLLAGEIILNGDVMFCSRKHWAGTINAGRVVGASAGLLPYARKVKGSK